MNILSLNFVSILGLLVIFMNCKNKTPEQNKKTQKITQECVRALLKKYKKDLGILSSPKC